MSGNPLFRLLGSRWLGSLIWIAAISAGLLLLAGAPLGAALAGFLDGAFGGRRLAYLMATLQRTAMIGGMALSVLLSFRAGLFNIGGEGQLVVGGLAAAMVGVYLPGPPLLVIAAGFLAAMLAGGLWGMLAGALQLLVGVPLLVGSLLLNYPARYFASYMVSHPFRDVASGMTQTHRIPREAWLPAFPGTTLDIGIAFIAVLSVALVLFFRETVTGYRARMAGASFAFARASGIPVTRLTYRILFASGAVAGLTGAIAVFGLHHRYIDGMLVQPLFAWTGIVAVLLVGMVPWAVPFSAFFFAALQTGAAGIQRAAAVPQEVALVIQAVIILFVAARISVPHLSGEERK